MRRGVPKLLKKIVKYRPRVVCFLSKAIWEAFRQETSCLSRSNTGDQPSTPQDLPAPCTSSPTKLMRSRFFPIREPLGDHEGVDGPSLVKTTTSQVGAQLHRYKFQWGPQSLKLEHDIKGAQSTVLHCYCSHMAADSSTVCETLFYVVPSPSARVVKYQVRSPTTCLAKLGLTFVVAVAQGAVLCEFEELRRDDQSGRGRHFTHENNIRANVTRMQRIHILRPSLLAATYYIRVANRSGTKCGSRMLESIFPDGYVNGDPAPWSRNFDMFCDRLRRSIFPSCSPTCLIDASCLQNKESESAT